MGPVVRGACLWKRTIPSKPVRADFAASLNDSRDTAPYPASYLPLSKPLL